MKETGRVEAVYRSIHPRLWRAFLANTPERGVASDAEPEAFAQALHRGDDIVDVASWFGGARSPSRTGC
jgi:hypothetical protein